MCTPGRSEVHMTRFGLIFAMLALRQRPACHTVSIALNVSPRKKAASKLVRIHCERPMNQPNTVVLLERPVPVDLQYLTEKLRNSYPALSCEVVGAPNTGGSPSIRCGGQT